MSQWSWSVNSTQINLLHRPLLISFDISARPNIKNKPKQCRYKDRLIYYHPLLPIVMGEFSSQGLNLFKIFQSASHRRVIWWEPNCAGDGFCVVRTMWSVLEDMTGQFFLICLLVAVPSFSPIFPFLKYHMGVIKFLNCFLRSIFQLSTQPWIQKHKQYLLWACFMLFAKPPRSYCRFCHLGHLHCLKQALCGIISHSFPQCFTAICTQFKTFLSYS